MARRDETSDYSKEIGKRIIKARLELDGMTQKELSELLHVSQRSAQAYEAGEVIPYARMSDIAGILGVSQKWLLHGDEGGLESAELRRLIEKVLETNTMILGELRKLTN